VSANRQRPEASPRGAVLKREGEFLLAVLLLIAVLLLGLLVLGAFSFGCWFRFSLGMGTPPSPVCVRSILAGPAKIFTFQEKNMFDKTTCPGKLSQQTKRLIASASPPAEGKEVNNVVIRPPCRWFVVARVPRMVSAFCDF
jgi:hypothetical protein